MSLKITPEVEASMRETKADMDRAMKDPSFRAEVEETVLRYDMQEAVAKLFAKAVYAKRFAALPKRRHLSLNISFGAGEPAMVGENAVPPPSRRQALAGAAPLLADPSGCCAGGYAEKQPNGVRQPKAAAVRRRRQYGAK